MRKKTKAGNPKVAIGYLRVSTDDQRLGPEAQRAAIELWAAREGVTIASWHVDQGVSGGSELDARPGLLEALAGLKIHGAGLLVVGKRDRLARDVFVCGAIEKEVVRCGAVTVSADGVGNGTGPADAFMRSVIDAASQYERSLIALRTRAALAVKRRRGQRVGSIPYGWSLGEDGVHLEEVAKEQETIALVCRLFAGGLSARQVVKELTQLGHSARSGKPFDPKAVWRLAQVRALPFAA